MLVTTITTPAEEVTPREHQLTEEQLKGDLDFYSADMMAKKMMDKGLITEDQYRLIRDENARVFKPFLKELY